MSQTTVHLGLAKRKTLKRPAAANGAGDDETERKSVLGKV